MITGGSERGKGYQCLVLVVVIYTILFYTVITRMPDLTGV